jgi:hypothetical protein
MLYNRKQLRLSYMGQCKLLVRKRSVPAQSSIPVQNIANYFSLVWSKTFNWHFVDGLTEGRGFSSLPSPP